MNTNKFFDSQLSTSVRGMLLVLIASLFTFLPTAASQAVDAYSEIIHKGAAFGIANQPGYPGMSLEIPAGAVTDTYTINISAAGSADLSQISLSISEWTGASHFNSGKPAKITLPKSAVPYSQLGYSQDNGATWTLIPLVADSSTITADVTGTGYVVSGSNVIIYTYHFTTFGSFVNSSLVAAANAAADAAAQAAAEARRAAEKRAARVDISQSFTDSKAPTLQQFTTGEISGVTSKNLADVNKELLALPPEERSDIAVIQKVAKKYGILDSISQGGKFSSVTAKDLSDVGLIPVVNRNAITHALRSLPTSVRNDYAKITTAINQKIATLAKRAARLAARQ
jgi:hypothetical protein